MDDRTGSHPQQSLWIDWKARIVSFHEEAGYERRECSSHEEAMEYVVQKTSDGFRVQ